MTYVNIIKILAVAKVVKPVTFCQTSSNENFCAISCLTILGTYLETFQKNMKSVKINSSSANFIGRTYLLMLLSVLFIFQFDGVNGDRLIRVGSEFTKNQKFTIEELKEQRRKDQKLDDFLTGKP